MNHILLCSIANVTMTTPLLSRTMCGYPWWPGVTWGPLEGACHVALSPFLRGSFCSRIVLVQYWRCPLSAIRLLRRSHSVVNYLAPHLRSRLSFIHQTSPSAHYFPRTGVAETKAAAPARHELSVKGQTNTTCTERAL